MKFTIFLALALAAFYVAQAETLHKEDAQRHVLEQEQDTGITFQEPGRQKRENCSTLRCAASCARNGMIGLCRKGNCLCHLQN